jgi:hypothetical protein
MNTITPSPELIASLKANREQIIHTLKLWFAEYDTDLKTLMNDFMLWVADCSEFTQNKVKTAKGAREVVISFYRDQNENYTCNYGRLVASIEHDKAVHEAFLKSLDK